jgi:biotin carboxyl carrier protein
MKKYKFQINGTSYQVDIKDTADNVIQLEVNGSPFEVKMETEVKKSKTPTLIRTEPRPVQKVESLAANASTKKVNSPLPGVIHSIMVKEGDKVKIGDVLLVLEAMKMENQILAEASGTVSAIKVQPHSTVLQGDLLVEII